LIVHETTVLDAYDRRVVDAIPVTSSGRTLLDLGAVYGDRTVERALEAALRRNLLTVSQLDGFLGRLGRSGRNGAGVLRRVLAARRPGAAPTDSDMETRVLQLLRRHGLPPPATQFEVRDGPAFVARVDFAYPELKIAIEYDSYQEHLGAIALVNDAGRRNALAALGWAMLVATASDVRSGGRVLVAQLRATRSQRALTPGAR
jgi:very-short-patch-repair endonuclease